MAAKVASQLAGGLTEQRVKDAVSVSAVGDTNLVDVSATSTSPQRSAQIANTYSDIFVNEQETADHQYYESALSTVNQQLAKLPISARSGSQGLALQERAQTLATLADLPTGAVQLAAPAAAPTAPSSPRTARNTVVGALLGLFLGLLLAVLMERLDQRIREPKELETLYDLPLLGVVPDSSSLSESARRARSGQLLPSRETESFHLIRAHLRFFQVDRDLRVILIASAATGDGKTTVARHLAAATAQMGSRVLLVEADLRRPTVARRLNLKAGPGLADVLIGAASLDDAIQTVEVQSSSGEPAKGYSLSVLVAGGTPPPNPGALLDSHAMERLLARASDFYSLVVVDTAPLTAVSDTFPLLQKVGGVILVAMLGSARRDVARRLSKTLETGSSPLLGVVANGYRAGRNEPYGYAYYDYSARPADDQAGRILPAASHEGEGAS